MWPLIAGAAAAPILGGLIGNAAASSDAEEARRQRQLALEQLQRLNPPSIADQRLDLNRYQTAGQLNPIFERAYNQGPSSFYKMHTNAGVNQAQFQALGRLQDIASQGGITQQDRDRMTLSHLSNARQEQGQRGAINQNMAMHGMGGSGMQIASHLQAQQSAANRNSQDNSNMQAQAQSRALQALMSSGEMANQMRSQRFNEQAEAARAQDMINNFNARNTQAIAGANVDRQNQAQVLNLQNSQGIMNQNVGLSNAEQMHNKGLYQQQFDNQARIAQGMAGGYMGEADAAMMEAARKRAMFGSIGQGVGLGLAGLGMQK